MFKGATLVTEDKPLFKGATPVSEAPAGPPKKTREQIEAETKADMARMADPSAGMGRAEKLLVGVGAGFSNVGRGIRSLANKAGLLDEEAQAELKKDQEDRDLYEKYHPGGWATAGELVGEGLATAPVGGVVGTGAKVLTKAVPVLSKVGGGVLGTAARGATEGAISNVITGPEGESLTDRAKSGALVGGAVGGALPLAVKAAPKFAQKAVQAFSPSTGAADKRALNILESSVGGTKQLDEIAEQARNAPKSMLPQTLAAKTGNAKLASLERGARNRGSADFIAHDKAVDKAAWDELHKITEVPGSVDNLKGQPGAIYAEGQAILDKLPLSQKNRVAISDEVAKLRNTNEVIANPDLNRDIDKILAAVDNPNATLGVLPQLYTSLDSAAAGSPAIREAKKIIKGVADERSKGQFSNVLQGYGATKDAVRAAETAQGLRGVYQGKAGIGEVPPMKAEPLQRGLEQGIADLDPETAAKVGKLTEGLRGREIYRQTRSPGATVPEVGSDAGTTSMVKSVMSWPVRTALAPYMKGLDNKALKQVDEALLDPDRFLKLMDARRARKAAIEPWEQDLDKALRGTARSAAIQDQKEGRNAP